MGRLPDGMVVHVPHVIPGEEVEVAPVRRQKSFLVARVERIAVAAPQRVAPPCPYYGDCGGCNLQHIDYEGQVRYKAGILEENLLRANVASPEEVRRAWREPAACASPLGYRVRIRLHVDPFRQLMGFHQFHSHRIVPVSRCAIACETLNEVLGRLGGSGNFRQLLAQTDQVELTCSGADDGVVVSLFFKRKARPRDRQLAIETCCEVSGIKSLFIDYGSGVIGPLTAAGEGGDPLVRQELPAGIAGRSLILTLEASGFLQVNRLQNERLVSLLLEWAAAERHERVLDLFCGMGNFSLPLALRAGQVVGMDLQGAAVRSARRNAELNDINNCKFEKRAAGAGIEELNRGGEKFDLVLLDPPRQGCAEVVPGLLAANPARIIYISCDPATLARDLAGLTIAQYELEQVRMVDMFPQTHHMETISLLKRR